MTTWQNVRALYQIYPRSFRDTNGDGIGDINGIIEKLPYLKGKDDSLGIDALWISPFYPSPMRDFGYDVSDYRGVHQMFGNLDDFERLIDVAHAADIKIMIDFVPNHTSDEHEWFVSSRSGKESVHRDWYIWRDPSPAGGPPNNWLSVFGGSAWQYDEESGQYYLHSFLAEQPDLNWESPLVRAAMNDVLRFWLDKGVDGFRCDAVRWIAKDDQFRDDPVNPDYSTETDSDPYHALLHTHSRYGNKLFEYLGELSETVASYEDRLIIFEDYPDAGPERMKQYMDFYRKIDASIAAPINYDIIHEPYSATEIRRCIGNFQAALRPEDIAIYGFGNHDNSRLASRLDRKRARLMALLQLSLPGVPIVYYGDEIGMIDVSIPPDAVQDPFEKRVPGKGLGRDPERTPMQWDDSFAAGFSRIEPWLPVAEDSDLYNVAREQEDVDSFFHLYKKLLAARGSCAPLIKGNYSTLDSSTSAVYGFARTYENETVHVFLNMSSELTKVALDDCKDVILSTNPERATGAVAGETLHLAPHEGIIVR